MSSTNPDHYKHSKIEAIDYIRDTMGHEGYIYYCEGATKKYLHRFRYKGHPLEDLKKAQVYLGWMIEAYEEREREEEEYEKGLLRSWTREEEAELKEIIRKDMNEHFNLEDLFNDIGEDDD